LHDEAVDDTRDDVPFIGPMRDPQVVPREEPDSDTVTHDRSKLSLGRYRGSYGKRNGMLRLDLNQMHFEAEMTGSPKWSLRYSKLKSVRKVRRFKLIAHPPSS
jgi:hypothetical protein